jgi:hypothetical protein
MNFGAGIQDKIARQWFEGGGSMGHADRKRVVIRAALLLEEHEGHREFTVTLSQHLKQLPTCMTYLLSIEGAC